MNAEALFCLKSNYIAPILPKSGYPFQVLITLRYIAGFTLLSRLINNRLGKTQSVKQHSPIILFNFITDQHHIHMKRLTVLFFILFALASGNYSQSKENNKNTAQNAFKNITSLIRPPRPSISTWLCATINTKE